MFVVILIEVVSMHLQGTVNITTLQTHEVFWLWRVEEMGHSRSLDCEITEISRWLDEDYFANSLAVYCGNERIRCLIIGPESDHWQPWSLTPLLTPCRLVYFIYVTLWRCQLNTVRGGAGRPSMVTLSLFWQQSISRLNGRHLPIACQTSSESLCRNH